MDILIIFIFCYLISLGICLYFVNDFYYAKKKWVQLEEYYESYYEEVDTDNKNEKLHEIIAAYHTFHKEEAITAYNFYLWVVNILTLTLFTRITRWDYHACSVEPS